VLSCFPWHCCPPMKEPVAEGGDSISSLGAIFNHVMLDFWIRIIEPWKEKVIEQRKDKPA
jgi:hypothetical protein